MHSLPYISTTSLSYADHPKEIAILFGCYTNPVNALFIGFRDTASQYFGVVTGRSCGLQIRQASLPKIVNTTMARFGRPIGIFTLFFADPIQGLAAAGGR